jgi:hypothetical protein
MRIIEVITQGPQGPQGSQGPQGPQGPTGSFNSASFATTGSNRFNGNQTITGSLIQGLEGNIATGENSHAEGSITKAIGNYSHAEGDFTQAKGDYSHAEGQETIASGSYSHAEGYQTIALGNHQHVQGQYNAVSSIPSAFIVGNGTDDGNRSNLIHAAENKVEITGSLNVNGTTTAPTINTHQINPISGQDLYIQIPSGRLLDIWTDDNGGEIVLNSSGILLQTNATQNTWTFDKSGSLDAPGRITATSFTGSLQGTASFATTASYFNTSNLATTGSVTFTGNQIVTGSTRGNVTALSITSNTASMDLSVGNFFTLQLVSGSNTYINPSNILPGQTSILTLSTTGSATVSWPSSVKQPSGSAYVPTTTTGVDIVTLASVNTSSLYVVSVKNMI